MLHVIELYFNQKNIFKNDSQRGYLINCIAYIKCKKEKNVKVPESTTTQKEMPEKSR